MIGASFCVMSGDDDVLSVEWGSRTLQPLLPWANSLGGAISLIRVRHDRNDKY
jgi:hypothetical protein